MKKKFILKHYFIKFVICLESNITLNCLTSNDESKNNLIVKCHLLYFTIEYIRTV